MVTIQPYKTPEQIAQEIKDKEINESSEFVNTKISLEECMVVLDAIAASLAVIEGNQMSIQESQIKIQNDLDSIKLKIGI